MFKEWCFVYFVYCTGINPLTDEIELGLVEL